MSNIVKNVIAVTPFPEDNIEVLDELIAVLGGHFDYNAIVPMPSEIQAQHAPVGGGLAIITEEVIEWQKENWGTTKTAMAVNIDVFKDANSAMAAITFESANTPPIPVIAALSSRFHGIGFYHQYKDVELPDTDWGITFYKDGQIKHRPHRLNEEYRQMG